MNTFEITIQHKSGDSWPVSVDYVEPGALPVHHEDRLRLQDKWEETLLQLSINTKAYGTMLAEYAGALGGWHSDWSASWGCRRWWR